MILRASKNVINTLKYFQLDYQLGKAKWFLSFKAYACVKIMIQVIELKILVVQDLIG